MPAVLLAVRAARPYTNRLKLDICSTWPEPACDASLSKISNGAPQCSMESGTGQTSIIADSYAFKDAAAAAGKCAQMRFNYTIPSYLGGYMGSSIVRC